MLEEVKSDQIREGLENGAKTFLIKPIMSDDVRDMWQFCELSKINVKIDNNITTRSLENLPAPSSTTENFDCRSMSKKLVINV